MNDHTAKICAAILIGGLIGGAVALLYAPQSGRKTRKGIIKAARRAKSSTADLIEDTVDDVNDFINDLREKASSVADQGTGLTDKAKKEIITAFEQGQKAIDKQKQKFSEALGL